jgi:hypothetical protein
MEYEDLNRAMKLIARTQEYSQEFMGERLADFALVELLMLRYGWSEDYALRILWAINEASREEV